MEKIKLFKPSDHEIKMVIYEISCFIKNKIKEFNATGCVLGLSGGVDSTLVALLCQSSFWNENKKLKGYILPSDISSSANKSDAQNLADLLNIETTTIPISPIVNCYKEMMPDATNSVYHKGNLTSRIRANILHTAAATENKLVAGTGNRSEDLGIGYYTLFGDGAVHMSPIGDLPKRIVRLLVSLAKSDAIFKYYGITTLQGKEDLWDQTINNILNKQASAELEPDQTDLSDLCYTYETVELLIEYKKQFIEKDPNKYYWLTLLTNPQFLTRIAQDAAILRDNGITKEMKPLDVLMDFIKRHSMAQSKAKLVSPDVCKVEHLMTKR